MRQVRKLRFGSLRRRFRIVQFRFDRGDGLIGSGIAGLERAHLGIEPHQNILCFGDERGFAAVFHGVPTIGGRYSALTAFGLVPSGLAGVDPVHIYGAMVTGPQNMPVFSDANISPEGKRDIITFLKQIEASGSPGGADLGSLGPVSEGLFLWIAGLGVIVAFTIWLTSRTS